MKFSSVFFFTSLAVAAPQLAPRQVDAATTITDAIKTLEDTTNTSFDEISAFGGNPKTNYQAILSALKDTTGAIAKISIDDATGQSEEQLDQIAQALDASEGVIKGLEATVKLTDMELSPEIMDAIQGDVDAVKGAVEPFAEPLTAFAEAASKAGAAAGVAVDGLQDALEKIDGTLKGVSESLGISELGDVVNLDGIV